SRLKALAGEARTRPTAAGRRSFCDPTIGESVGEIQGYFAVHSQGLGHATRAVALARGMQAGREDLYFLFLAGVPALDLVVASGFDALTAPPAPDWPAKDGILQPVWRWYVEYARYLRVARRFLRREGDWRSNRFLLSDGEVASVREALRHNVPTALIVNTLRHDFAQDPASRLLEGYGNRWFSSIARQVDLILTFDDAPPWPNVRRIPPVVRPFSASREKLREDLFLRKKTILVTAGGTAIGEYLLRAAIEAFRGLDRDEVSMVVVSGPRLKVDPEHRDPPEGARRGGAERSGARLPARGPRPTPRPHRRETGGGPLASPIDGERGGGPDPPRIPRLEGGVSLDPLDQRAVDLREGGSAREGHREFEFASQVFEHAPDSFRASEGEAPQDGSADQDGLRAEGE